MGQKDIRPTRLTSARTSFKAMEAALINSAGSLKYTDGRQDYKMVE